MFASPLFQVQFMTIPNSALRQQWHKVNWILESQQPSRASYGVSIVGILEKIDRAITSPHCTVFLRGLQRSPGVRQYLVRFTGLAGIVNATVYKTKQFFTGLLSGMVCQNRLLSKDNSWWIGFNKVYLLNEVINMSVHQWKQWLIYSMVLGSSKYIHDTHCWCNMQSNIVSNILGAH